MIKKSFLTLIFISLSSVMTLSAAQLPSEKWQKHAKTLMNTIAKEVNSHQIGQYTQEQAQDFLAQNSNLFYINNNPRKNLFAITRDSLSLIVEDVNNAKVKNILTMIKEEIATIIDLAKSLGWENYDSE